MRSSWIAVRAVLEAAERAGVDREKLRQAAGLSEAQDTYGWVEHERYGALLESAVELSGNPTFGLFWGSSPMLDYELIPLLVANSPTLRACLENAQGVQRIVHEEPQMEFHVEGEFGFIRSTPDPELPLGAQRVLSQLTMASGKGLLEYCARGALRERTSYAFGFDPGASEPIYREMFGEALEFGCPRSEIRFPTELLDEPRPAVNAELYRMLQTQLEQLHARMASKLSYVDQVKIALREARPRLLEMPEVASALGMSARSLRRRLSEEGTSYSELLEGVQIEIAQQLLSDPKATVKSVAFELGFDSTSGFRRAFRRWTGENPADFRANKVG